MGEALKGKRDHVVLATKFGHSAMTAPRGFLGAKASRSYVRRAVEASLTRLQTDWIDLYQLHTPDAATPIEETLDVLTDLVREGKVRYIGHSNFAGWQVAEAALVADARRTVPFVSAQNHYSLLARGAEREVSLRPSASASDSCPASRCTTDCSPASSPASRPLG